MEQQPRRRRKGSSHIAETTDETSGEATTTHRFEPTKTTQKWRGKGAAAAMEAEGTSHVSGTTAMRRRKGAAAATEAEGSSYVSGTTDATSGEAKTTKRPETTTTTQTRRRKGAAAAPTKTDDGEGENGDVTGYVPTPEDLRLWEVYGD